MCVHCTVHNCCNLHTVLHRTDLIVFPLTLQTITTAQMMSIWGKGGWCTLAPPEEYDWTVHVQRRCDLMSNYFDHLYYRCIPMCVYCMCYKGGRGELGPHVTQCGLGQGLPSYQLAPWSIQPFGHSTHGQKLTGDVEGRGELCPFGMELGLHLSNIMLPGPRHTILPSGIFIHPSVYSHNKHGPKLETVPPFGGMGS